jgi:hypothetical protein
MTRAGNVAAWQESMSKGFSNMFNEKRQCLLVHPNPSLSHCEMQFGPGKR